MNAKEVTGVRIIWSQAVQGPTNKRVTLSVMLCHRAVYYTN